MFKLKRLLGVRNVFQLAEYLPTVHEVCASSASNSIGVAIHTCNSSSGTPEVEAGGGMIKSRSHLVTNQVEDQPKLQETVSNKFFQNNGHLKTFMNFKLKHYLYMGMNSFTVHHGTHVKTRSHSARLSSFLPGLKLRLSDVAEIALRTEQSLQAKNIILSICVKTLRRSQVTLITELYTKAA